MPHCTFFLILSLMILLGCNGCSSSTNPEPSEPASAASQVSTDRSIPGIEQWEANMRNYGRTLCQPAKIAQLSTWEGNIWYYDGIRVYYQIADYTNDPSWNDCARYVRDVYRPYVLNADGRIPGWRVFPHGLQEDYLRNGSRDSKRAVVLLARNSAFAATGGGADFELSRETAYIIHAYLSAEELGEPPAPNLARSVSFALGHLDQWTGSRVASYTKPFMMALTFEALIRYYERSGDPRIIEAIEHAANWLWESGWQQQRGAFPYILCPAAARNKECLEPHDGEGADLSLLIAPTYAWLYSKTGSEEYRARADRIFQGGVNNAFLAQGKQFSQNYRWSFDFVRWRGGR